MKKIMNDEQKPMQEKIKTRNGIKHQSSFGQHEHLVSPHARFTRQWAMPNKHTFLIKPIGNLIRRYVGNGLGWIDAFAGENSPAETKNDLNPEKPTEYHLDALEFLRSIKDESAIGVIYDPPYSMTQAKECYDKFGSDKFEPTSY